MRGLWHSKTRFTLCIVTFFAIVIVLFIAMFMPIAGAGIVPITAINDESGTISVNSDSRVFGKFYGVKRLW